ncbi:hypothetical protein [Coriobacterium glomerans]|nr:hypothetical protein [Coriobacterium glomerans]
MWGTASKADWESNMDVSAGASSTMHHHGFKATWDNVRAALSSWTQKTE